MDELRITDTNSVNDAKGRAFGLHGNDFIYVLIAFVAALGLYLLLNVLFGVGTLPALVVALPFLFGPLIWVLCLRHNKPKGYAEDWFDQKFNAEGWGLVGRAQPPSPYSDEKRA